MIKVVCLLGLGVGLLGASWAGAQGTTMPMPPQLPPGVSSGAPLSAGMADTAGQTPTGDVGPADSPAKRNPFWPVGYAPKVVRKVVPKAGKEGSSGGGAPVAVVPERAVLWDEARKKLDIRGVSRSGTKYWGMIGSRTIEVGDAVSLVYEKQVYRWRVTAIGSEGISFQKLDVRSE